MGVDVTCFSFVARDDTLNKLCSKWKLPFPTWMLIERSSEYLNLNITFNKIFNGFSTDNQFYDDPSFFKGQTHFREWRIFRIFSTFGRFTYQNFLSNYLRPIYIFFFQFSSSYIYLIFSMFKSFGITNQSRISRSLFSVCFFRGRFAYGGDKRLTT